MTNKSFPVGFILLGFSKWPFIETVLFWAVILLYTMVVLSNLTIILLSCVDPRLHTPMYFFLSNLSFLDLCFTTTAVPQMLSNLWGPDKSITYTGCAIQLSVLICLGVTEGVMLVVMAFDRYVAICQPLRYTIIMHPQFCWKLVLTAWLSGLIESVTQYIITFQLPFCTHHRLDDFLWNILIITATTLGQSLHKPMYFFLRNLSILDVCYISVTVPKACVNSLTDNRAISVTGCAAQIFLVIYCVYVELLFLTVMARDCYVATCQPLHYPVIMNHQFCVWTTLVSMLSGLAYSAVHIGNTFRLSFCQSNVVHQFFCDIPSLLRLSCSDSFSNILLVLVSAMGIW
ncbi:Olfactory Receptor 14C36 [Manis pentadactyla]|nr:Olfactory Receptor 14C36 [Manis pentadactyla]